MKHFKTFFLVVTALFAASCAEREGATSPSEKYGELCLSCCNVEMTQTKSRYPLSDDELYNVAVAMYDEDGLLTRSGYFSDMTNIRLKAAIGRTYSIFAVFNTGEVSFPASESDVPEMMLEWNSGAIMENGGFPAAWNGTVAFSNDGQTVPVAAERLIAKLIFKVDNSALSGHDGRFTVTSLALKNTPKSYFPFAEEGRTEGLKDFETDCSTASDVTALNNGSTAVFYTVENRRGTLLPGNTDPWQKVPDNIPDEKDKCTYVEVCGTYGTDGGAMSAPVTYRLYIGSDAVTNFDVNRNELYNVTLLPSDGGIGKASWKVTVGEISDTRTLAFGSDTLAMDMNSSETFMVMPYPSGMKYEVSGCETESAALSVLPTGNTDEWVVSSSGSLPRDTLLYLVASSWDGRVTERLPVKVTARYPVRLKVNCPGFQSGSETAPIWKVDWYGRDRQETIPYSVTVVYSDGTEKADIQSSCTAVQTYAGGNAGAGNCFVFGNGVIGMAAGGNADTGGNGTVTFSYTESGRSAGITVKWWKLYVLSIRIPLSEVSYGQDYYYSSINVSASFNDGTSGTAGTVSSCGLKIISGDSKCLQAGTSALTPLRYGSTTISSTTKYRGASLSKSVKVYGIGTVSGISEGGYLRPKDLVYAAYEDADGVHTVSSGAVYITHGQKYTYISGISGQEVYNFQGKEFTSEVSQLQITSDNPYSIKGAGAITCAYLRKSDYN